MAGYVIYADNLGKHLIIFSVYASVIICCTFSLWASVTRFFSPFWTACFATLTIGIGVAFSPAYAPIPVDYWDGAVSSGKALIVIGVTAVVFGFIRIR